VLRILSVDEVSQYVKDLFDSDPVLGDIWIRGEVSNFRGSPGGHYYFVLKSEQTQLRAVLFRTEAQLVHMLPGNGDAVLAHGRLSSYPAWGQYQLYVDAIEPEGTGLLQLRFEELRARLEADGLFDTTRKRPLPLAPRAIGVVTSRTGSVWHDIKNVLSRRYPLCELILSPSSVQGERAPAELVAALERLQEQGRCDVIIVARGGGSIEDLWCFNDEALVRAIFRCPVPVVSAIGHETDTTLCDLVADVRAPTPSAAAELVAPHVREYRAQLGYEIERLVVATEQQIDRKRHRLTGLRYRLQQQSPRANLLNERLRVDRLGEIIEGEVDRSLTERRAGIGSLQRQLVLLHPARVLERGYAIVTQSDSGQRIKDVAELRDGEPIRVHFHDGEADARVERVERIKEAEAGG
jgi:exodeoxyribonuclease VII large subunit